MILWCINRNWYKILSICHILAIFHFIRKYAIELTFNIHFWAQVKMIKIFDRNHFEKKAKGTHGGARTNFRHMRLFSKNEMTHWFVGLVEKHAGN